MLGGSAWASRGDRACASVEYPQQRPLAEWERKRARRRAELAEKTARRQAEFTALLPAIAAQVAADVSAAVAAALQATRAEPLKELDLAPTTTTTSIISESSTSIQMPGGSSSISTTGEAASASHDLDLPSAVPVTCSTECPRRDNGSSDATASVAASVVLDVALDISAPTRCLTMEPSLGNESLARVLASAKSDMALAEHYDKSEEDEDNSVPLFQWDPGEKPMVLRDSVLSRDIAWPACVKKMNADLSGSRDYDQKSGYADTQTYAESDSVCSNIAVVLMPQVLDVIPVTTSADQDDPQDDQRLLSTEVIQLTYDNHFGLTLEKSAVQPLVICDMFRTLSRTLWSQILYVELLKNQFDCAGPINKQYLECLTACATKYPSMCATTHSNCLLSWDPGDKTKLSCSSDNAIAKYFCQHIYKELLQYLYKQYLESLVVFAPAYLPIGVVQVAYAVLLLEYFSVIQKNCQLQYGDVKWWSDFSTIDGNHRTKANVGCVITATHFEQDLESECRTLIRNCPSNSDGALVDRIPFPLLEFVVKLVRSHNFIGGTVHLQFPQPLQEAQVYLALPGPQAYRSQIYLELFGPAGKASLYSYGAVDIQWEIAWPTTTVSNSMHYGMHLYIALECSSVIYYLATEINRMDIHSSFLLHLHWDPGGLTQHRLGMLQNTDNCPKGLSSWSCAILKSMCGFELLHWKIAWSLDLGRSDSGNSSGQPLLPKTVRSEGYLEKYEQVEGKERKNAKIAYHSIIQIDHDYCFDYTCYFDNGYCYDAFLNCISFYVDFSDPVQCHVMQWDPGGAAWWRLEGKPHFKGGGMLATTSTTTVGHNPVGRWAGDGPAALVETCYKDTAGNNGEGGLD